MAVLLHERQRKVKFPFEYDVLDLVTEELKQKLLPVNTRLKEIEKDRQERRKVRKRTRKAQAETSINNSSIEAAPPVSPAVMVGGPDELAGSRQMDIDTSSSTVPVIELGAVDEQDMRRREAEELASLVDKDLKSDTGVNLTGIYELVGE